jgi:hypothetical protein
MLTKKTDTNNKENTMSKKINFHLLVKHLLILSFFTTIMLFSGQAQTVYFVAPFGTDKNNGTEKFPFKTLLLR